MFFQYGMGPAAVAWQRVRSKRDKCYAALGLVGGSGRHETAAKNAVEDGVVEGFQQWSQKPWLGVFHL